MKTAIRKPMFEIRPAPSAEVQVDRLTGIVTFHHQHPGANPFTVDVRFSDALDTTDPPYQRPRLVVGQEWVEIDTHWVKNPSVLIISNDVGQYQTNPSVEQRKQDLLKIVELAFDGSKPWLIRPGRPFVGEPLSMQGLRIRCQHGTAEVTISAIPR